MLKIRDFLLSLLGGTELMWDVALGVVAAVILCLLIYAVAALLFYLLTVISSR
jgi:hypothetical protein